jgi:multiple RNA-binding domain-containing protein 1
LFHLTQHFKKCGKVHSAVVSRKQDPKRNGQTLSMGFGFVQYRRKVAAQRALKELQRSLLDGHQIEVKLSHRAAGVQQRAEEEAAAKKRKTADVGSMTVPKIMVRNIPFQANRKEIHDLFR